VANRILTNSTRHHFGRLAAWSIYTLCTFVHLSCVRRGDVVFLRLPPLQLGVTGILARYLRGARVLLNVQDIHPDLAIKAALAFERWIYRHHKTIVVISEGFKKNLITKGVPAAKIMVLPNWVDTDFLLPLPKANPVSEKLGLARKFVMMYSGTISISSYATLVRILDAAALIKDDPDIRIAIVGEGFKAADLKAEAARRDLPNVVFLPFQPYADLPRLLAAADALLVPLDKEKSLLSVPSKLYNFMAAGRPVFGLAHRDSEVFQIIEGAGCGRCAPPDEPAEIAAEIRRMKGDAAGLEAMGARGRAYALEHVSRGAVVAAFEKLMSEMP
jgi:colanic acid biosynthesis glycosyl transferase WcaI